MSVFRRYLIVLLSVMFMLATFATPAFAGAESQFVSKINASRAAAGKAPLEAYWDLADDARSQAGRMAAKGEIFHNPSLSSVTGVWESLGENVGVGPDVASLHAAFMNSASHRRNILGDYNYIGVGVKTDEAGFLWVTMIFMRAEPGLNGGTGTTTTTTTPPVVAPVSAPVSVVTTTTTPPVVAPVSAPVSVVTTTTTTPPVVAATSVPVSVAVATTTPATAVSRNGATSTANSDSTSYGASESADNGTQQSSGYYGSLEQAQTQKATLVVGHGRPGTLRGIID